MMLEVRMELEKETKNTIRYQEVPVPGENVVVGTIYVQKTAFDDNPPTFMKVTLEEI